ncbi:hypothetical protein GCM10010174_56600 [Kutzneria viridogrisea]|uniref:DUF2752 domain-containing protein n=1 Tax=Kutzneria viridogrisea TaxID=47990 RepID=A0ABR6BKY2_9PSEU|nr:hypothetical protein [Kutzneria viridogrisea]
MSTTALRATPVAALGAVAAGVALGTGALSIPCWYHALTGLDCPFCGGSRALGALLRLDLPAALGYNAFAVLVLLPAVVIGLVLLGRRELGRTVAPWTTLRWALAGLAVLAVAWWVLRDLPQFHSLSV